MTVSTCASRTHPLSPWFRPGMNQDEDLCDEHKTTSRLTAIRLSWTKAARITSSGRIGFPPDSCHVEEYLTRSS